MRYRLPFRWTWPLWLRRSVAGLSPGILLFDPTTVPATFMVDKLALWQVCLPVPVFPCQYHSTIAPHSPWSTCCHYQKDKRAKPGDLPKSNSVSELQQFWVANCFHFFYEPSDFTVIPVRLKLSFSRLWPSASALILISLYIFVGQVLAVLLSPRWSRLELAEIHMGFKVSAVALGQVLRRIHTNSEKRLLASSCLSVRLSIRMEQLVFLWTIFLMKLHIWVFFESRSRKLKFDKNLTGIAGTVLCRDSPSLFTVQYTVTLEQYSTVQCHCSQCSTVSVCLSLPAF